MRSGKRNRSREGTNIIKLLKNAAENEKEIFALLIKQFTFIKELSTDVHKADSNEIIK